MIMLGWRNRKARVRVGRAVATLVASGVLLGGVGVAHAAAPSFTDVDGNTPHREDIVWLAGKGVTEGFPDGRFGGMNTVVRQDMAAFLYRMAGSPKFTPSAEDRTRFTDVDEATPHHDEIWWLASTGITGGYPDGTFGGMRTVVRQDMAAFLHRWAQNRGVTVPETVDVSFTDTAVSAHGVDVAWLGRTGVAGGFPDGSFGVMRDVVRQDMAAFLHRLDTATTGNPTPNPEPEPDKPTTPDKPDKPTQQQIDKAQAALDAAKQATVDAQADVDKARSAYDTAEKDAAPARAQWARGSLGFYETEGYTQGVNVLTKSDGSEGGYDMQDGKPIVEEPWYKVGDDQYGTSLNAMMKALPFYRKINEVRVSEGVGQLQVSPRQEALAQAAFAYQRVQPGHRFSEGGQNLGEFHGTYDVEKANWEREVAKDPSLAKYKHDFQGLYNDPDYDDLVYTVGHYLNMIDPKYTAFGLAAWPGNGNDRDPLRVANFASTKYFDSGYHDTTLVTLDLVPVDEYAAKLTAYVDGLEARIKPADDAKAKLDQAQAKLDAAKQAQADAQAALDALVKA